MDLKAYLARKREQVEAALATFMLQPDGLLAGHIESMRYSLFAGGKRIRPVLCLAVSEALHVDPTPYLPLACSLECIHTYSLIHDDLPAMDNDDLRRGKPTNHKVFGEAAAILAGDSLLTFAFELLAAPGPVGSLSSAERLRIIALIARAIGPLGMVGGQSLDIESEGKPISFETLQYLHSCKTGALITAAVQTGAVIGRADETRFAALTTYGRQIGLAFQIVDDLLNVEGTAEQLGKAVGSDARHDKATYPSFFGVEKTREMAKAAVAGAVEALADFDDQAEPLRELARYIYYRKR
ncbi:MAG: polyprenyl synthetase family protein [Deltaproteobacteria bacterium]|nr:polyprenyl synthetase family protein [Deltaproteobacteria bacterium]